MLLAVAQQSALAASEVTWARDIAPILQRSCVACHRPDGAAPFSLQGPSDAKKRARLLAEVTTTRTMPPWLASGDYAFTGDRRLSREEIETIARWANDGAPLGDLDQAPEPTSPSVGWQLGTPDLTARSPSWQVPADGSDVFRNFILEWDGDKELQTRRRIRAVEIRPTNSRPLHHAVLTVDHTGSSRRLDRADPEPGWNGMESASRAFSPEGLFLGWTPGKAAFPGYPDLTWELAPRDDLVVLAHLLPTGRSEPFSIEVGLFFEETGSARQPSRRATALRLGSQVLDIPAGGEFEITDRFVLPVDAELRSVYPHAHYLGKSFSLTSTTAAGDQKTILVIERWNFEWQDEYRLEEALVLPAGTTLEGRIRWDNSAENPHNPSDPPQRVRFGPGSEDEMGDLWVLLVARDPETEQRLAEAATSHALGLREAGLEARLARDPGDLEARRGKADIRIAKGDFEAGELGLRTVLTEDPNDALANGNLGNVLMATGRHDEAVAHFERAATLEPWRAEAWFNLANGRAANGRFEEALADHQRALTIDADDPAIWLNRGIVLNSLARHKEERASYERALSLDRRYAPAWYNLALALIRSGEPDRALEVLDQALGEIPDQPRLRALRQELDNR